MTSRETTFGLAVLTLLVTIAAPIPVEARPPNFIIIFIDDQGYNDLACIGKWQLGQPQGNGWNPATMPNAQGFDLEQDIGERRNVADAHPGVVARLRQLITDARAELGDYNHIGAGARFFDNGPKRTDRWTGD